MRWTGDFTDEPLLFAALQSLRQERARRAACLRELIPSESAADEFADALISSLRRRESNKKWGHGVRIITGLAACLFIGFSVGWMGRASSVAVDQHLAVPSSGHSDSHRVIHAAMPVEPGQFQVAVLDENGNVIAVQRFNKMEEARQFANDLGQYEARRQQVQEGQAMLISDRF